MRCPKCNSEYEGEFCPNCDSLPSSPQSSGNIKKSGKLLGFRTNKIWKKVISISYLVFCFIYLLSVLFTEKYVNITDYDFLISQICDSLIFVIMISPYIFLSNTKFRNIMPLFKKYKPVLSAIGLIIFVVIIGIISGVLEEAHTSEFLADRENHAYIETVTEASCEEAGEIKQLCEYCGISSTEIISAKGHKMAEISRIEATETADGKIIKKCSVCGKEETTVLEKIKSDNSKSESSAETKAEPKKDSDSKDSNSKKEESVESKVEEKASVELTDYIGQTVQDMMNKLNIEFVQVMDNDYFYSSKDGNTSFEVYTKKTGGIKAVKLLYSGKAGYTICGLKSGMRLEDVGKKLTDKKYKSLENNMWVDKSQKDVFTYSDGFLIYEKDSPYASEEAMRACAEEVFEPKYKDSTATVYLGNGQIAELLSDSFSEFSYNFSQMTDYQQSEYINDINGRYVMLHGDVTGVESDGTVVVYCDDYNQENNMWLSGTASASVKLITQQLDSLVNFNKGDEVIILARIDADTYNSFLGTGMFDLYDGILYSINGTKEEIPYINETIDGIYQYYPEDYTIGHGMGEY